MPIQKIYADREYVDNKVELLSEEKADKPKYITPEEFGAKGNWANDAAALQACLDYASEKMLPVRGFGRYAIYGNTITIDGRFMDVYLHALDYTGEDYAVRMRCAYSKVEIHTINASKGGGINCVNSDALSCLYNKVKNQSITSLKNCIHIGNTDETVKSVIGYCAFETSRLSSSQGNCIRVANTDGGELYFDGSTGGLEAPTNYAMWFSRDIMGGVINIDRYSFEHGCKSGLYIKDTKVKAGYLRTREIMDTKRVDSGETGMMLKLVGKGEFLSDFTHMDVACIDITERTPVSESGELIEDEENISYVKAGRYCNAKYYGEEKASYDIPGYIRMTGAHLYIDYEGRHVYRTVTEDADLREWAFLPPTTLDVKADATYILNTAYCSDGIDTVTINQTYGKSIIVKDNMGNTVFDGVAAGPGVYLLSCTVSGVEDLSRKGWAYDPAYDVWRVDKLTHDTDGTFEEIETITLEQDEAEIIRTACPDGTPYDFKSVLIHVVATASTTATNSVGCTAYLGDGSDDYYHGIDFAGLINNAGASALGGLLLMHGLAMPFATKAQSYYPAPVNARYSLPKAITPIKRIMIKSVNASYPLPSGTVIKILGVKNRSY